MDAIELLSPAKINLFLEVLQRNNDGYHSIETVFQEINLCDQLTFRFEPEEITLETDSEALPLQENNLVYLAAKIMKNRYALNKGVHIKLQKKIPIAAGLGGGSSNAAATIRGLNLLWELGLDDDSLFSLAREIGADVSFFLTGGTVMGRGRGDDFVNRVTLLRPFWVLIVNPGYSVLTRDVYHGLTFPLTNYNTNISLLLASLKEGKIEPALYYNRLEEVVFAKYPLLKNIKTDLAEAGGLVSQLSGSGPTVFALTETEDEAKKIQACIKSKYKNTLFSIVCCTTIR